MAFFDQLGQKLTQTSQDAVKKTKDMAEVVRLNSAIADEGKKIEAAYREIGRLYFEHLSDSGDPILQPSIAEIKRALAAIQEMKDTISGLKGVRSCPSCGAELPIDAVFCTSCGVKMPEPPVSPPPAGPVCPACGAPAAEDMIFCTNCGTKLPEPVSAPIPAQSPDSAAGQVEPPQE